MYISVLHISILYISTFIVLDNGVIQVKMELDSLDSRIFFWM
jgi:hypothetical protein